MQLETAHKRWIAATLVALSCALAVPAAAHDERWRAVRVYPAARVVVGVPVPALPIPRVVVRDRGYYGYGDYAPAPYYRSRYDDSDSDSDHHHRHGRYCHH